MLSITAFLETLQASSWAVFIHKKAWAFTTVEVVHVFAVSLVLATIAIVDLRLLGFASTPCSGSRWRSLPSPGST